MSQIATSGVNGRQTLTLPVGVPVLIPGSQFAQDAVYQPKNLSPYAVYLTQVKSVDTTIAVGDRFRTGENPRYVLDGVVYAFSLDGTATIDVEIPTSALSSDAADARYAPLAAALGLTAQALPQGAYPTLVTDPGNLTRVPVEVQITGTARYVSNGASNGYALGNDANNGLTKAAPFLTLTAAHAASSAGDAIVVNPTATTYAEAASLNVSKKLVIAGDPSVSGARASIGSASGQAFCFIDGAASTYANLTLDGNNEAAKHGVQAAVNGLRLVNVWAKNFAAARALALFVNPNVTAILEKCGIRAADGNVVSSLPFQFRSTGCNVFLRGTTVVGVTHYGDQVGGGANSFYYEAASDGARSVVNPGVGVVFNFAQGSVGYSDSDLTASFPLLQLNAGATMNGDLIVRRCNVSLPTTSTHAFLLAGTVNGNVRLLNNVAVGTGLQSTLRLTAGIVVGEVQVLGGTYTDSAIEIVEPCGSVEVSQVYSYNTAARNRSFLTVRSSKIMTLKVARNVIVGTGFTTYEAISLFAASLECSGNDVQTDSAGRSILIGTDGYTDLVVNTAATTGDQPLGSASGTKYVSQVFTAPAAGDYTLAFGLGAIMVAVKKVGTATQTVTCGVYADNAGSPGTLVAVSNYTLSGASMTGSYQWVTFWSDARAALTPGATYHLVLTASAIDGSNYLQVQRNSTGTALKTSADGATYSTGTGSAMFKVQTMCLECKQPVVAGNRVRVLGAALTPNFVHGVLIGSTDGAIATRNEIYDARLCLIFKMVDGSVLPAIASNNVMRTIGNAGVTAIPALYDKASKSALFFQNTVVSNDDAATLWCHGPDTPIAPDNTAYNATPARGGVIKNNVGVYLGSLVAVSMNDGFGSGRVDSGNVGCACDYNVYYTPNAANFGRAQIGAGSSSSQTNYPTLASWRSATGFDLHSTQSDPTLVSTARTGFSWLGLKPQVGSPALTAGVDLAGLAPLDFLGAPQNVTPSAGAFYAP